jgi:hypothetical protein
MFWRTWCVAADAADPWLLASSMSAPSLATELVAHRLTDPESTTRALGERLVEWIDAT